MRVLLITIPNPPLACPVKNKTERERGGRCKAGRLTKLWLGFLPYT